MAETEILNVGGPQGVASEATLLKLIELTRQQQRGQSSAAQAEAKLRKAHNDSIKKGSENVGILGKAAQAGAKAFDTYTKVLKDGVGGVSDFTDSMKFLPSTMKSLIRFADASTHQFRELSQVGAGFSNSIFEMNKVAATSGMAMTDFYETVNANSTTMRFLSGSVQEGAKRFAEVSHGLRSSDLGETLFNMGFSIGEINEGFLTYTNNMQRQGMLQGMSNRELIEGSADYLKQIDLLAKATGASRKEFLNQTEALQESAQFQSLLARAGEGADDLTNNLAFAAQTLGGQFTDDLVQISSGTGGLTDLGIALQQVNGGRAFTDLMKNAENMDPNEFMRQFSALAPDIRDSIKSQFSPAEMRLLQGTPLGALFDTLGGFSRAAGINVDKIIEEQKQRDAVTSAFAGFQQAVADLSKFITDNFLKSETFKSLKELGTSLSASFATLFGPVSQDGSFDNATQGISSFVKQIDTFVKEKLIQPLTTEINKFTAHMENNGDAGTYFKEKLKAAGNKILDFFLGEIQTEPGGPGRGQRAGGAFSKIGKAISSLFAGEGGTNFIDTISTSISDTFTRLTADGTFISNLTKSVTDIFTGLTSDEGFVASVTKSIKDIFSNLTGDEGFITKLTKSVTDIFTGLTSDEGFITSITNSIKDIFSDEGVIASAGTAFSDFMKNNAVVTAMSDAISNAMDTVETSLRTFLGMTEGQTFMQKVDEMVTNMTNSILDIINNRIPQLIGSAVAAAASAVRENFGGGAGTSLGETALESLVRRFKEDPSSLGSEERQNLIQTLRENQRKAGTDFTRGYMPGFMQQGVDMLNDTINWDSLVLRDSTIMDMINNGGVPARRIGTLRATGKATEPNDTLANIHAGERVLNPQEAAAYNSQSDLGGAINRLNTTTAQLVTLMKQNNRITSGISNDFLKGSLTV